MTPLGPLVALLGHALYSLGLRSLEIPEADSGRLTELLKMFETHEAAIEDARLLLRSTDEVLLETLLCKCVATEGEDFETIVGVHEAKVAEIIESLFDR